MRSALRPVFSSWIEIYCVWVWGVLFKFQPFSEGACIVRTSRLQLKDECRFFFSVWSCQNWLSNTHTWWGGVCGVMQSSGTKRLKFRRALRWLETQQFGRWHENDVSLCWSHAWSSNTWDNQTCCLSAFYTLISLFNFHSYPTDLDIIRLILRIFLISSLLLLASV